jgi:hypothetical protein
MKISPSPAAKTSVGSAIRTATNAPANHGLRIKVFFL